MRSMREMVLAGIVLGLASSLVGCGESVKEGTLVERTPEQVNREQASMKGMMDAMKAKAPAERSNP
jgi:hypothetical protein